MTWAPQNEEMIIENREQLNELRSRMSRNRQRHGEILSLTALRKILYEFFGTQKLKHKLILLRKM